MAHDPLRGRDPQLGARAVRAQRARASATSPRWLVFTYLWLPYMILPIYAGLERIPNSLLDASGDLGAGAGHDVPPRRPAAGAARRSWPGSIFTFSLTLGDYITPQLVSSTQFIGNVVYANVGVANNLPLAAAFATVPGRDHDRLPADRPAAGRVRGAVMRLSAPAHGCLLRVGTALDAGVHLRAAARDRPLRVQRARGSQTWPIPGLHARVVRAARSTTRACATRCGRRSRRRSARRRSRSCSARSPRSRSRATGSSAARRSRSS